MKDISLKELLEAGCHFGHQTNRWNPKASDYIYGNRDGVHIIDLAKTKAGLVATAKLFKELAKANEPIIFVATKRQAREIMDAILLRINEAAHDNNFFYLLERWPGGLLTNFEVIKRNNLDEIVNLENQITADAFVTKKEKLLASRKLEKYKKVYGGLVGLKKTPSTIFLVDVRKEEGAVREAVATGVKVLGIVDTNTNPTGITEAIPANDDAVGSLKIIIDYLAEAWLEGLAERQKEDINTKTQETN